MLAWHPLKLGRRTVCQSEGQACPTQKLQTPLGRVDKLTPDTTYATHLCVELWVPQLNAHCGVSSKGGERGIQDLPV